MKSLIILSLLVTSLNAFALKNFTILTTADGGSVGIGTCDDGSHVRIPLADNEANVDDFLTVQRLAAKNMCEDGGSGVVGPSRLPGSFGQQVQYRGINHPVQFAPSVGY
jgi:hypothetical protein